MRHLFMALLLCGCGGNTIPVQNDGAPTIDMTMQQSNPDLTMQQSNPDLSMSASNDFSMPPIGDLGSFTCGKPGMAGNEKGVGAYCTAGGGQCTMGTLCPADFGVNETFCTLLCSGSNDTTTCGTGAQCQCMGAQCGCVPSCCLNASC